MHLLWNTNFVLEYQKTQLKRCGCIKFKCFVTRKYISKAKCTSVDSTWFRQRCFVGATADAWRARDGASSRGPRAAGGNAETRRSCRDDTRRREWPAQRWGWESPAQWSSQSPASSSQHLVKSSQSIESNRHRREGGTREGGMHEWVCPSAVEALTLRAELPRF